MLREGRRRPWRGQPRPQRQPNGRRGAPRRCSPPGVGIIGDVQSSAGASGAALGRPKQHSPQYSRRPIDAHDSPPMPTTAHRCPRQPTDAHDSPASTHDSQLDTQAPHAHRRPQQHRDAQSNVGAPRAALGRPKQRSPKCFQRPTDAANDPPMPTTVNGAHDDPASTHNSPARPTTPQPAPKHTGTHSSTGPPKATLPAVLPTSHRCHRQPTDAHDSRTTPMMVKRRLRRPSQPPRQPTQHASTQAPTAAPGRPKQRWDAQSSAPRSTPDVPPMPQTAHRCPRQPTDALNSPAMPTTAQPAVPGPGERPSGAIMTPPVRPPRRALGRTRGEPPLIREKPAIPAKNTRRSNRGRPARERLRPVSRHLHPMSHNTCAPRENGAGRHASRAGGI